MKTIISFNQCKVVFLLKQGSTSSQKEDTAPGIWLDEGVYTIFQVRGSAYDKGSIHCIPGIWLLAVRWREYIYTVPGVWLYTDGSEMKGLFALYQVSDYWLWNEDSIYTVPGIWLLAVRWREYTLSCIWVLAVKWREYIHCTRYLTTGYEMKRVYTLYSGWEPGGAGGAGAPPLLINGGRAPPI